ncbi:MAG: sulfatase [Planctomycetaceae bacterium]|nr:sulfatase [Planctomycetaceae bacterium]
MRVLASAENNRSRLAPLDRRGFLSETGRGLGGIALGSLLASDGIVGADDGIPDGRPHLSPRIKSVIWLFMVGGASHVETFDPKPALNKYAGISIDKTPFAETLKNPFVDENVRIVVPDDANGHIWPKVYPLQVGFRPRGESGIEMSDWWPHLGQCVDDLAIVRSMWTTDNNHGAQLQFHTGRHSLDGFFPTIGSWIHYGLGSLNEDLPQFVVMGTPIADCCGGQGAHGGNYLGPEHSGVQLNVDPANPLPFATPGGALYREEQQAQFQLLDRLNRLAAADQPADASLRARIKSYQLAYRMQMAVPETMQFNSETKTTQAAYGIDNPTSRTFGQQCLAARRLVERGVRFIQIFHGSNGGAGRWDGHSNLQTGHARLCLETDQPIAGLIRDLKARGLFDETLIVWGTEFGRTPGAQNSNGRDHHPYGFSVWMAGGGLKRGVVHGNTDELGFHAIKHRHYITDVHATVMQQLGIEPRRLEIPGRKRLDIDYGRPIEAIIA